jgi:hypothetical protein
VVLVRVFDSDHSFGRMGELADGTVVTAGQVAPHLTAADVETILFD